MSAQLPTNVQTSDHDEKYADFLAKALNAELVVPFFSSLISVSTLVMLILIVGFQSSISLANSFSKDKVILINRPFEYHRGDKLVVY